MNVNVEDHISDLFSIREKRPEYMAFLNNFIGKPVLFSFKYFRKNKYMTFTNIGLEKVNKKELWIKKESL